MSFRIHRRDTEICLPAKFGENRPLRSCRKVAWITIQKNLGSAGLVPASILPKMGRSRPKFLESCHPLICPRIPNFVGIGCVLLDLFRKDWLFGAKSQYNVGFQPTMNLTNNTGNSFDNIYTSQYHHKLLIIRHSWFWWFLNSC